MATKKTTAKAPSKTSKAPTKAPVKAPAEPVTAQEQVQEQAMPMPQIEARINELNYLIDNAEIVDDSEIDETKISIGSIVVLYSVERNCELTYHIVGSFEADPKNGKISDSSPIGAALLGAREGEEVVVEGARVQHLQIKKVSRAK